MSSVISIVAEKPSIARALVRAFSIVYKMKFKGRKGKTRYNYIFEAEVEVANVTFKIETTEFRLKKADTMLVTSVTGHVLNFDYPPPYDKETNWHNSDPIDIVDIEPIEKPIDEKMVEHLTEIGKFSNVLVIATDWDGHGEAIGREIIDIASKNNKKLRHGRMRFTSTNPLALQRSFENQTGLDWSWIKQVDSLRKQDLRMGSSITRFLTIGVQDQGIQNQMISYGPCQTSVLYLITHRYNENKSFIPEKFWKLSLKIIVNDENDVDDKIKSLQNEEYALVTDYNEEVGYIKRPLPLDTDTLEAECSSIFRVSPKQISDIAERLYNNGFITYPRTESSYYHEKDLTKLTSKFSDHEEFGIIAKECLELKGVTNPSKGRFTKDHEPIKPVKAITKKELEKVFAKTPSIINLSWLIYSYIVWRFLATVHVDAKIMDQYIILTAGEEEFIGKGKKILDLGFLNFYKFRRAALLEFPKIEKNTQFPFEVNKHLGF
ncbi:MAG: DNA topoisomerase, partial [Candidatus Hodarchaeales archaeon]